MYISNRPVISCADDNCVFSYSTRGSQKVPGNMVQHSNRKTYDNAYLITFKVGPLRAHTFAPSILLLLEVPAEGFFWNLPEFGRCFRFDVLHGCKSRLFEPHFQSREQPKVTCFSQRSSLVMSPGCSPTTRRQRCSQQSGIQRRLPDQRNHALSNPRKK